MHTTGAESWFPSNLNQVPEFVEDLLQILQKVYAGQRYFFQIQVPQ